MRGYVKKASQRGKWDEKRGGGVGGETGHHFRNGRISSSVFYDEGLCFLTTQNIFKITTLILSLSKFNSQRQLLLATFAAVV